MKKHFSILTILLAAAIFFSGCYAKPNGNFILKGILLYKSDSTPVSGHQVTVMYQLLKAGLSGKKKMVEVGSGKSDSSGSFKILCDYYNTGSTYYFKEKDLITSKYIEPTKEGDVVDLDTLYLAP